MTSVLSVEDLATLRKLSNSSCPPVLKRLVHWIKASTNINGFLPDINSKRVSKWLKTPRNLRCVTTHLWPRKGEITCSAFKVLIMRLWGRWHSTHKSTECVIAKGWSTALHTNKTPIQLSRERRQSACPPDWREVMFDRLESEYNLNLSLSI